MKPLRLHGLVAAPFAPFNKEGDVDCCLVSAYASLLKENGVVGVFVNGTSGESHSLTVEERKEIAEAWMKESSNSFTVMVHVGHASIKECEKLARHAHDIGGAAFGTMAPIFFKPSSLHGLVDHCAKEANFAGDLPYYYYHIPQMSGVDFSMRDFLELAGKQIPNLAGIKFSKVDPADLKASMDYNGGKYEIMHGNDESLITGLVLGAKAAIGSTYSFAAPLYNQIIDHFNAGRIKQARECQHDAILMVRELFKSGSLIAACKFVMKEIGIDLGPVRSPLQDLDAGDGETLRTRLESMGFFSFCCK